MKRFSYCLFMLFFTLGSRVPWAQADIPIIFTFENVTYEDGNTALTGSFTYDPMTNTVISLNITAYADYNTSGTARVSEFTFTDVATQVMGFNSSSLSLGAVAYHDESSITDFSWNSLQESRWDLWVSVEWPGFSQWPDGVDSLPIAQAYLDTTYSCFDSYIPLHVVYDDLRYFSGMVTTTHAPLPPSVWLLASGLLGLVGWRSLRVRFST